MTDHRSLITCRAARRWLTRGLALLLCAALAATAQAQQTDALKAAFVLNFLKFAEWPASAQDDAQSPLVIVAIGGTPLAASLKTILDGKLVQGCKVEVHVFRDAAAWAQAAPPCRALFVTPQAQPTWGELRERLAGQPVLTIGEAPGFCAAGGMLNLYEQDDRIRFEANPEAVEKDGLKLRAELLKLATLVKTDVQP